VATAGGETTADAAMPAAQTGHWLNEGRVRVYSWMIVVIFAVAFVVWLGLSLPGLVDPRGKPFGYDFMAYWSAAQLALAGHAAAAFDQRVISAVQHAAVPSLPGIIFPWQYPPTFLLPVVPLGLLPYVAALAVFVLGTGVLWAGLVRQILPDRRAWIVAAAAPAGLINLLDGQNAFLTAALAGFALIRLDRRPIMAGVLIGLLAVKPHLAVLFPLALLAEGRWRSIAAAAATVAALCAASLLAFGWQTWAAFLHHLPLTQAMADSGAVPWGTMPSPFVFALSLGASLAAAWALQAAAALFAAACVWRAWRSRDAPFAAKAATLVAGSLLVSPYLFYYDLLWAALGVAWLATLGLRTGFRRGEREILLFAFLVPALMPPVQLLTGIQLGFPAVLLLLVAAVSRAAPLAPRERALLRRAVAILREARWITRERLMFWGIGLAAVSLILLARDVAFHTARGIAATDGTQLAGDFTNYFAAAKAAAGGQASLAYDRAWFNAFERSLLGPTSEIKMYPYPPVATLLLLPLALLPFIPALIAWVLLGVGACFALLRRLVGWRAAAVAVVGAPASFFNLFYANNGHLTAALLGGGLMLLDRWPVIAGIAFGCLAYKPHLALLLPFALAAGRRWRAFAAAAATAALLVAASIGLFGTASWVAFLGQLGGERQMLAFNSAIWSFMPTVFAAARLLGAAPPLALVIQLLSGAIAIAATVAVWRGQGSSDIKAAVLVVATFLAVPYAWDYDTVILLFAAAWLGREGLRTGFRAWERLSLVLLLGFAALAIESAKLAGAPLGPAVLWLVMVVLVRRAIGEPSALAAAAWRRVRSIGGWHPPRASRDAAD
jgi:Glycosyltransferase family 87